jgi:hypothetical protein
VPLLKEKKIKKKKYGWEVHSVLEKEDKVENVTNEDLIQIINLYKQKSTDLETQFLFLQAQNKNTKAQLDAANQKIDFLNKSIDELKNVDVVEKPKPVSNKVELKSKETRKASKTTK